MSTQPHDKKVKPLHSGPVSIDHHGRVEKLSVAVFADRGHDVHPVLPRHTRHCRNERTGEWLRRGVCDCTAFRLLHRPVLREHRKISTQLARFDQVGQRLVEAVGADWV